MQLEYFKDRSSLTTNRGAADKEVRNRHLKAVSGQRQHRTGGLILEFPAANVLLVEDSRNNQLEHVESHPVERSCLGGYSPTTSRIGTGLESVQGSLRPPGFTATTRTCSRSPAVRFLIQ